MRYQTHAEWCRFLASIGELDPKHARCVSSPECVVAQMSYLELMGAEEPECQDQ